MSELDDYMTDLGLLIPTTPTNPKEADPLSLVGNVDNIRSIVRASGHLIFERTVPEAD